MFREKPTRKVEAEKSLPAATSPYNFFFFLKAPLYHLSAIFRCAYFKSFCSLYLRSKLLQASICIIYTALIGCAVLNILFIKSFFNSKKGDNVDVNFSELVKTANSYISNKTNKSFNNNTLLKVSQTDTAFTEQSQGLGPETNNQSTLLTPLLTNDIFLLNEDKNVENEFPELEDKYDYVGISDQLLHGKVGYARQDPSKPIWTVLPPPEDDFNLEVELMKSGGLNVRLSDSIPLDRDVKDLRKEQCKNIKYDKPILPCTVIIIFNNEYLSFLLRSVHSVLARTPRNLLYEILLVDDQSTFEDLREDGNKKLENYIKYLPKTRLIRSPKRTGIVGTRLLGIKNVKSPIFVILDSHIEVSTGWLEPLAARITENSKVIVMPEIYGIESNNLSHFSHGIGCTLGIIWKLMEHSFVRPNQEDSIYQSSPTMAGGLFAVNTKFFLKLGGYDEGMMHWGTENLELSFRIWMCGGILECSSCSKVYHAFRQGPAPFSKPYKSLVINKMRTIVVWMDQYADFAWRVIGKPVTFFGDVSERVKLRQNLKCKSFEWFLKNIWPESYVKDLPIDVPYLGDIRNVGKNNFCLDSHGSSPDGHVGGLSYCSSSKSTSDAATDQNFMYFRVTHFIMPVTNDEACLNREFQFVWCYKDNKSMMWIVEDKFIRNSNGLCLGANNQNDTLLLSPCDHSNEFQKWIWNLYDPPARFSLVNYPLLRGT